jgi:ADP-heptose:LPS heptosyltransferase
VTSSNQPSSIKSLLIIKPSSLGDIVHALQILQTVAPQLPGCRITWVVRDRFAPLVQAAPFIHEVILFRRKEGWRAVKDVMKTLRERRFDAVWDMQGLLRSGLMTWAARSSQKWGRRDSREGASLFYNRRVDLPAGPGPHHAVATLQGFARAAGLDDQIRYPLALAPGPAFVWQSFFADDPRLNFVIFTDSRGVGKEWKGFEALTHLIWKEIPGSRVAWCAGRPTAPAGVIPDGRFLNLTGCPLDEMIALARTPSVFIGNDSGPMHLSAASGNRVLAIFGPTSPLRFGPWPVGSPRSQPVVAPGGCLADLHPTTVLAALQELRGRG